MACLLLLLVAMPDYFVPRIVCRSRILYYRTTVCDHASARRTLWWPGGRGDAVSALLAGESPRCALLSALRYQTCPGVPALPAEPAPCGTVLYGLWPGAGGSHCASRAGPPPQPVSCTSHRNTSLCSGAPSTHRHVLRPGGLDTTAPDTERTYVRAQELCQQLGDTPQLFPVLRGLMFYI
jgi:hypothetical protein